MVPRRISTLNGTIQRCAESRATQSFRAAPQWTLIPQRRQLICYYCNEAGHRIRECPEIPPYKPKQPKKLREPVL